MYVCWKYLLLMIDILNVFVFYVLEFEIIFCLGKLMVILILNDDWLIKWIVIV